HRAAGRRSAERAVARKARSRRLAPRGRAEHRWHGGMCRGTLEADPSSKRWEGRGASMLKVGVGARPPPEQIQQRAKSCFKGDLGLNITAEASDRVTFAGWVAM